MESLRVEKLAGHQKEERFMLAILMELLPFGMRENLNNYVISEFEFRCFKGS